MSVRSLSEILWTASPVLPVLTVAQSEWAEPLAKALYEGGARAVEVTLRTTAALDVIRIMREAVPELIIGAGTVIEKAQLAAAKAAGATFAVSPGLSITLLQQARDEEIPLLPGVATPSEMLKAMEFNCKQLKLFPAQVVGGVELLRAVQGPFSGLQFCPTGGINGTSYREYLALENVICVGGSWFVESEMLARGDWSGIEQRMRDVCRPV